MVRICRNMGKGSEKGGLFRYADWKDKLLVLLGTLGSVGDGLMNPLVMYTLSNIINEYAASDPSFSMGTVDRYARKLLYIAIIVGVSAFIEGMCWTITAERQVSRMRLEYLKSVLRQEVAYFDTESSLSKTSQVISSISTDAHTIQDTMADKIPTCLSHITSLIFLTLVAFLLSWRLALAVLPLSIMLIVLGVGFGVPMMGLGMKAREAYGVAGGIAEQAISAIRVVYSYVGERQTSYRFSNELGKNMGFGVRQGFIKGLMMGSMGVVFAAWGFQAWVGGILVSERGEKGGPIFISGTCVVMGGLSFLSALPSLSSFSEAVLAATRINEMIDQTPKIDSNNMSGKVLPSIRGEVEFKEVHFSYPSRPDTPILQGLKLKVKAGKMVGLVGESGSGKSTVISLLQRFYDPDSGSILLDGCKISRLRIHWLRSHMGLVNQEPILFATSIKENILYGKEGAPMGLVTKAAKAANAHDFISKLPNGYDTEVGQFGVQLSGGQKQRIAIARALIREPKILLLDEATSALDAVSERTVQEALDQASTGRTTIVVAHRLSTIRRADEIVVLKSGKVIESGSHDELMRMYNGTYNQMVDLQKMQTQNEDLQSSYYPTEGVGMSRTSRFAFPRSPVPARKSHLSSPAYPFSPFLSVNTTNSIDLISYNDNQEDTSELEKPFSSSSSQWRLLKMNAPEWKNGLLGCLGAIGSGAIQPAQAYCLGSIVSVYFVDDNSKIRSESRMYCFIFLGIALFYFVTNIFQHYNFAIMGERLTKRVRGKMFEKILTFEVGWFDKDENMSAAICAGLDKEAQLVKSLLAERMSLLIQVFFSASIAFVVSLVVAWRLSIVIIAVQPVIIGSFYSKAILMKKMSEKARKAHREGCQLASEAITNHRTITAFSSQRRILELFEQTLKEPMVEAMRQSWFSGFGLFSSQFANAACVSLTYWYGGMLMHEGLVDSKHIFLSFFLLMSTGRSIADAGSMSSDLAKGSNAIRSVFAVLDRDTEIDPDDPNGIKLRRTSKASIELKDVVFSYPARPEQTIFKGLSLKIEAGKTIALVGQSGSGKSTIIGLIERFYDPISGEVLIDDCDIRNYNLRKLRSHIALVNQEPTLFAGSIRENIAFGCEDATEGEIRKAALLANAHEFISSMEGGYDTYCGERGVQLSGGQKQRIALARAILKDPKILLLDEATSALDSVSERLVQDALEKMMVGRTCVVVAHRLSTIQKSHSIAVIKNGVVVERGSHSDLLAVGCTGAYFSLIKLQGGQSPYR